MTKDEFKSRWFEKMHLATDSKQWDTEINFLIKDEIKKFAKFINGNTTSHLFDEITKADINSYLNQRL